MVLLALTNLALDGVREGRKAAGVEVGGVVALALTLAGGPVAVLGERDLVAADCFGRSMRQNGARRETKDFSASPAE